jgi:hypothetical protein
LRLTQKNVHSEECYAVCIILVRRTFLTWARRAGVMQGPRSVIAPGIVVLALAGALFAGCGGPDGATTPDAKSAPSSSTADQSWQARSELQEELLRSLVYSAQSWPEEPRGDVRSSPGVPSTLVLARVVALPEQGRRVRFDCCQIYVGRAAFREARRDGDSEATINAPVYVRNAFEHVQELLVASRCPVVTNTNQVANGFSDPPSEVQLVYWLIVGDDGKIHGALWQPTY